MIEHDKSVDQTKRNSDEITFAILTVIDSNYSDDGKRRKGLTKMEIMADVFITHECATGYLEKLEHEGLIDYNSGTGVYMTTDSGRQWMMEQGK